MEEGEEQRVRCGTYEPRNKGMYELSAYSRQPPDLGKLILVMFYRPASY